jgi:hypothetical protein
VSFGEAKSGTEIHSLHSLCATEGCCLKLGGDLEENFDLQRASYEFSFFFFLVFVKTPERERILSTSDFLKGPPFRFRFQMNEMMDSFRTSWSIWPVEPNGKRNH